MENIVYADVLFFVNFSMDFLTLYFSGKISGKVMKWYRLSISAVIGSFCAILLFVFQMNKPAESLCTVCLSAFMTIIAFGWSTISNLFIDTALIWGVGALLGGIISAVGYMSGPSEFYYGQDSAGRITGGIIIGVIISVVIILIIKKRRLVTEAELIIEFQGRKLKVSALVDSGNLASDPISGESVIFISEINIIKLIPEKEIEFMRHMKFESVSGELAKRLRIIPIETLDSKKVKVGFLPDKITVFTDNSKKKKEISAVIVPDDIPADNFGGFGALISAGVL